MSATQSLVIQYLLTELRNLLSAIKVDGRALPVKFVTELDAKPTFGFALWVRSITEAAKEVRGEQVIKVTGADGKELEVLSAPPVHYQLSLGFAPTGGEYLQVLGAMGAILQAVQDNGQIPLGPYAWVGHNSDTVKFTLQPASEALRLEAARNCPEALAALAIGFTMAIGINSAHVRTVKRVIERKLSAEHKPVDQIPRK